MHGNNQETFHPKKPANKTGLHTWLRLRRIHNMTHFQAHLGMRKESKRVPMQSLGFQVHEQLTHNLGTDTFTEKNNPIVP